MKRRELIGSIAGSAALAGCLMNNPPNPEQQSVIGLTDDPIKPVKVGIIGLGGRGFHMTKLIQAMYPDMGVIKAICDIRPERVQITSDYLSKRGQTPDRYAGSADSWKSLVSREDLDLIFVFTHWGPHTPMCVAAMEERKHVAVEVPAAKSLEEAWELVDTAEKTQRHCMMLENVCYGEEELWVLNMVQNDILGKLTYGEAGYIHDLRDKMFGDAHYKRYRLRNHYCRQGNLYPTHGLGPLAQYMNILRGDKFDYLISMSSPEKSLTNKASSVAPDHDFHGVDDFNHGDMNMSLIKTNNGRMLLLKHDVVTHRPYSRINAIAGTKGYHEGHSAPTNLALKGYGTHGYLDQEQYSEFWDQYSHPIWDRLRTVANDHGGHGGKDFILLYRLFDALNKGRSLDMDVYDAATWSAVSPLSAISVQNGGQPVSFPDFTRGNWNMDRELGVMKYN